MDGTGSGSFPVVDLEICVVETSVYLWWWDSKFAYGRAIFSL